MPYRSCSGGSIDFNLSFKANGTDIVYNAYPLDLYYIEYFVSFEMIPLLNNMGSRTNIALDGYVNENAYFSIA
jgi:hypothetical protein